MNTCKTACEPCRDMIQEYVEGCCSCDVKKEVETHLAECGECRLEHTAAASLARALGAMPALDVPETFSCSVMDCVAREDKTRRRVVTLALSGALALLVAGLAALAGPGLLVEGTRAALGFAGFALSALTGALVFLAGKITYAINAASTLFHATRAVGGPALPILLWGTAVLTAATFILEATGVMLFARRSTH